MKLKLTIILFLILSNSMLSCVEKKAVEKTDAIPVALLDESTGLVVDDGLSLVKTHCTPCHSAKIISQNRATEEGWRSIIVWMQETQNLWDLGENEDSIITYLAKNYAPKETGRRKTLSDVQWYELTEDENN